MSVAYLLVMAAMLPWRVGWRTSKDGNDSTRLDSDCSGAGSAVCGIRPPVFRSLIVAHAIQALGHAPQRQQRCLDRVRRGP